MSVDEEVVELWEVLSPPPPLPLDEDDDSAPVPTAILHCFSSRN